MISIQNQGPPIDETCVVEFEARINARIPAAYREFLLAHNGGQPNPDTADIDGLPESPTDVKMFFGFGTDFKSEGLIWNFELMNGNVTWRHLLPIAGDSGGCTFCLDLAPESYGRVVFFDLKGEDSEFYDVAPDFETFLEKLYPWPDD